MKPERLMLKIKVTEFDPEKISGSSDNIISFISAIDTEYSSQGQVHIEAENDSYYNGCTHFSVYISRLQTDEEYELMVAQEEIQRRKDNNVKAQKLVEKKLKGKSLTKKEISFLKDLGINIS